MLSQALRLLVHDRPTLRRMIRLKLLDRWCRLHAQWGFYCQARMDIDPSSWWHNTEFVSASGGYVVPGDATPRKVLPLEAWDTVRRDMILLLLRELIAREVQGDLAELGVYRGYSARLIHHYLPERKFYLFDTFTGFDERDVKAEHAATGRKTDARAFSQTGVERALSNIAPQNGNVETFPGYFPESAPPFLAGRRFAFVHLDADLYEPMLAGLNYFYDKVVPGGFILAHDFNSWPGARKAIQQFFRDKPEIPIPMPDKSGSALVVKLGVGAVTTA
ncbi:MAG: TylF/MycF/NovP-related O-methyltransferase [Verrucomicrobiota bacterium]